MRPILAALFLWCLWLPSVFAQWDDPFIGDAEPPLPASVEEKEKEKGWKEGAWTLPPWPRDGDLVAFRVDDPASDFRQYIDGRHIRVDADGAVRYTLVVESRSGVRNVSFEGLRCTPKGAYKVYAYGYAGRFEEAEGDWMEIRGRGRDSIHRDLHRQLLCIPGKFEPRPKKDMIRAMRTRHPIEANRGLFPD